MTLAFIRYTYQPGHGVLQAVKKLDIQQFQLEWQKGLSAPYYIYL
jgi:hypothetical protein